MENVDVLTERFKLEYDRFLIGCDALEEEGLWDMDALGEMEACYQNDLVGVILRLIASDGEISARETEYLNKTFGFEYAPEELEALCQSCLDAFDGAFDEQARAGYRLMQSKNEKLADAYRELLELVCDILKESDGVAPEELEELDRTKRVIFED